jgi:hypothetical protein
MQKRSVLAVIAAFVVGLAIGGGPVGVAAAVAQASAFDPENATYAFAGDSFTLAAGKAQIMGHSGLPDTPDTPIPIGYTFAKSASGDVAGDGGEGEVVALYRNFGANLQWIVLFGFVAQDGAYTQIASGPAAQEDASLQSLSVDNGAVTVMLLVVSDADKQLPHSEQKPTQPLTLRFTIEDGKFVETPGS